VLQHPAPGSCIGRCILWPRLSHWYVAPLLAHVAEVCVAYYPMRRRMSRPALQPRSRSCRAWHDGKHAWNPSLSAFRASRLGWQGEPQMETLCGPPDYPVHSGCLHRRLPIGPPQECMPRTQAVAIGLGRDGPCARCRPCTLCCALAQVARGHAASLWTPPGVSGLCRSAVCKTMRAATGGDRCTRATPAPVQATAPPARAGPDMSGPVARPRRACGPATCVIFGRNPCGRGPTSQYRGDIYGRVRSQPQGVGA
jgi:hypothetical protein